MLRLSYGLTLESRMYIVYKAARDTYHFKSQSALDKDQRSNFHTTLRLRHKSLYPHLPIETPTMKPSPLFAPLLLVASTLVSGIAAGTTITAGGATVIDNGPTHIVQYASRTVINEPGTTEVELPHETDIIVDGTTKVENPSATYVKTNGGPGTVQTASTTTTTTTSSANAGAMYTAMPMMGGLLGLAAAAVGGL